MANPSFEKGPDSSNYINQSIEREMKKSKYNGKEFLQLASAELMSGKGYSLIKGEMFEKLDASGEKVSQAKVIEYFDGLGGEEFKKDIFEKARKAMVKECQRDPEAYWKKYAEDYDKRAVFDKKLGKNALTPDEEKRSDLVAEVLASKEKLLLSEITLQEAIDSKLFPKFEMKDIVSKALTLWETQEVIPRKKALKKSIATSGSVSRRVALQSQAKGFTTTIHTTEYEMGSANMAPEVAGKIPELDKNMKYRATGGVSTATWDSEKPRPESEWRSKWSNLAKQYTLLYTNGRVYNEFSTSTTKSDAVFGVMDALVRLNAKGGREKAKEEKDGTFEAVKFKRDLDKRFGKEIIYGSHGVFNMLLAFERASKEVVKHGGQSDALYDLQVGGSAPKHRYSQLDTKALQDGEVKDAEPAKAPEAPKDLLDRFNDEMVAVVAEVEKSTGVKITRKPGVDSGIKVVDYEGEYKGEKRRLFRAITLGGKIQLSRGAGSYLNPKDAASKAKELLLSRIESLKILQEVDAEDKAREQEKANKEKWYKDFDAFLDTNRNDFIKEGIVTTKELQHTYKLGAKDITITYDYVIRLGDTTMYVVPMVTEGKLKLWARIVNKSGTTMKELRIKVDFKDANKFTADIKSTVKTFKGMEEPTQALPPLEKGPAPKAKPAPAQAVGLPEATTPQAAKVERTKPLWEGLSNVKPKDLATAIQQLQEINFKISKDFAWGPVLRANEWFSFNVTKDDKTYAISTHLGDSLAQPGKKEIQFTIKQGQNESIWQTQWQLARQIETILAGK